MNQQEEKVLQKKLKKQRRALLKSGIGATVAVAGAGAVTAVQATMRTAHADGAEGPTQFSGSVDPVVSVTNTNSGGSIVTIGEAIVGIRSSATSIAVNGQSTSGVGVSGQSNSFTGVRGTSFGDGFGVSGIADNGTGVEGFSSTGTGVSAQVDAVGGTALSVKGSIKVGAFSGVSNNPTGTATLAIAASSVTVTNPVTTANSIVLLTPQSDPGATVWVTTAAGSFTIHRAMSFFPIHPAVTFNYLIIN